MKRVLHVIGGMNRAGAETMIMNIYRAIDHNKFQFDFLVYNNEKQDYEDEIESLGGRVIHMPVSFGLIGGLKSIKDIRGIIKKYGPYCAIHAATLHNSAFALLAAIGIKDCKKIVHSHNTANTVNPSIVKGGYNIITKWIIQHLSDECIACGQEAGEYLFGKRLFNKKGIILNNSVDVDRFYDVSTESVAKLKEEFGVTSNMLVIGSVARLCSVKNHERMIEIAYELAKRGKLFKMIFVGRGDLEDKLKKQVTDLNLTKFVIFAGIRSDIPEMMHLFDVFLMPSLFEGNPVTLVEAQVACLPSIISDTITAKIDFGLGLIKKISLKDDNVKWIEEIISNEKSPLPKSQIIDAIKHNRYDLNSNVQLLSDIYEGA